MNRREILKGFICSAMAPAFIGSDVLMPIREIVLPSKGGNKFLTPELFAREALELLRGEILLSGYENPGFGSGGRIIKIRRPQKYKIAAQPTI